MCLNPCPVLVDHYSNEAALLCDARELHKHLEVGKTFAAWIKARIAEYGFLENQDYITIFQNRKIGHGRGRIDYHLTLDTAKELAMVERNEKGRQARRYFINCERRLHRQVAITSRQKSPHLPQLTYASCRVLHTYNERGVIVSSQLAKGDEMLTSPTGFIELMMRRQGI